MLRLQFVERQLTSVRIFLASGAITLSTINTYMKNTLAKLSLLIFSLVLISCNKDSGEAASTDLAGSYNFISLQVKAKTTQEALFGSYNVTNVITHVYTTQNNGGTLTIDSSSFNSSSITYSVNTVEKGNHYENGVLTDTFSSPLQFTLSPSNGRSIYRRITPDSIYSESGSFAISGSGLESQPSGAKIRVENGRLIITSEILQSTITTYPGSIMNTILEGTSIVTWQKR